MFLAFLRRRVCAENLICVRMIAIFEEHMCADEIESGQRTALQIYRYFVAPSSAFEVSLHHARVGRSVGRPSINHSFNSFSFHLSM